MNYWINKDERKLQARRHTREMINKFSNEIKFSINSSIIQPSDVNTTIISKGYNTKVSLIGGTSEDSIIENCGVLNFASYHNAGGKFYSGSSAQEESLCHRSFLFNVLNDERFNDEFYSKHDTNKGLYDSDLIISPKIIFDSYKSCTVVTCAAVNAKVAKNCGVSDDTIYSTMKDRIDKILFAFTQVDCRIIILGAFGCGVFGNSSHMVASIFRDLLESKYFGCFEEVIFTIPDNENYSIFENVFSEVLL